MSKKSRFIITLTNASNSFKVYTIVTAYDEDTAMEIALKRYEGLQVYDTALV